jgi:mannose-1-phosphate guanylyltransferase
MNLYALLQRYNPEDIYVSVSENYVDYIRKQGSEIPRENYIIEPHIKKATGPATCYSMIHMALRHPDEVIMYYVQPVIIRTPVEKYLDMIEGIEKIVKQTGNLVTGGKYPLYPEVGSDYQKLGARLDTDSGLEVYNASDFIFRPKTLAEASEMLSSMKLALHCNHSTWTSKAFFEELKKHRPDWYSVSMELVDLIENKSSSEDILRVYSKFNSGNIELFTHKLYSQGRVNVVILPFEWRHITTWNDIYEYQKDNSSEISSGLNVFVDSSNNLIINKTNRLVSGVGLKDMIIIETEDSTFICPRDSSGRVGEILSELEQQGLTQYL